MILIDSKVGSRDLVNYPPLSTRATLTSLVLDPDEPSSADVCITGKGESGPISIGIELCSITDLISKLWDGRLQGTQIPHLKRYYTYSWILYFGSYRCGPKGQLQLLLENKHTGGMYWQDYTMIGDKPLPYSYVAGFFVSPDFLQWEVNDCRVLDMQEAAAWIYTLHELYQKSWIEHRCMRKLDNSSKPFLPPNADPAYAFMTHVAQKMPGVGGGRCYAFADHFDCALDMMTAGVDEYSEIETESAKGRRTKVGPVRAQAIYDLIRRKKGVNGAERPKKGNTGTVRSRSRRRKAGGE